jgi:hypothetical protein
MARNYYKPGDWNAICDRCGFKFKASELREEWTGLRVCEKDFELRHPLDFLRAKTDKISVPWVRMEAPSDVTVAATSSSEALGIQYLGETSLGGP